MRSRSLVPVPRQGRTSAPATPWRGLRAAAVVAVAALALSGCASEDLPRFGMPKPATDSGNRILFLWQGSWVAALIVGVFVWALIFYALIRFRRRGDSLPVQSRYNIPIEVLYTLVPLIIVAVLFVFTVRDQNQIMKLTSNPAHTVHVNGIRWSWQFTYDDAGKAPESTVTGTIARPPTLVLPKGEKVRFVLTSQDVDHSFWVPAFLFKMDLIPGRVNQFEVTPTREGEFAGRCAELCGTYHSRMLFTVKVVSPDAYRAYLENLKAGTAA